MKLIFCLLLSATAHAKDIIYFTDLEGSRARLESVYEHSGAFFLGADAQFHLKPDQILVYGGDATDRYYGSIQVVEEIVRHHEEPRNRGRVHSIVGNREVKEMRFTSELTDAAIARPPMLKEYTKADAYAAEAASPPDRVRRMKFMLANNMGSPEAFKLLHDEIKEREGKDFVSDEEVVRQTLDSLKPGGAFAKMLGYMRLGVTIGNTVFVHGGLTPENIGVGMPVDQWLNSRNSWYLEQYNQWLNGYMRWTGVGPRAGEDLLNDPMPKPGARSKPESLITGRHVDNQNNPLLPDEEVIAYLAANGKQREIVGHTPIGHTSVIVRNALHTFESIFADISYSPEQKRANWVRLIGPDYQTAISEGWVQIDGVWQLVRSVTKLGEPTRVGLLAKDGTRVIGHDSDSRLIGTRMENFKVLNRLVSPCEIELQ
jgi:hypothetical protein